MIRALPIRPPDPQQLSLMANSQSTAAILVAAGRGLRAGAGGPKQYRSIGGKTVIFRAMEAFCTHPGVAAVQPVLHPDDVNMFNAAVSGLAYQVPTNGGATHVPSGRDHPREPGTGHWTQPKLSAAKQAFCLFDLLIPGE